MDIYIRDRIDGKIVKMYLPKSSIGKIKSATSGYVELESRDYYNEYRVRSYYSPALAGFVELIIKNKARDKLRQQQFRVDERGMLEVAVELDETDYEKMKEAVKKYKIAKELQKKVEEKARELEKEGIVESTVYGVIRLIDGTSEDYDITADLDETLERLQRIIEMLNNIDLLKLYKGAYERYRKKVEEMEEEICKFAGNIRELAYEIAKNNLPIREIVEKLRDIAEEYCPEHIWI
jgi:hypothetical protein